MEKIRACRIYLNRTQKEFARDLGVPLRSLQRWEQGQNKTPDIVLRYVSERYGIKDRLIMDLINSPEKPRARSSGMDG